MKLFSIFIILGLLSSYSFANQEVIKHGQTHSRYSFGLELLELALSKVGNYKVVAGVEQQIDELRIDRLVVNGRLDVEFLSTTKDREKELLPIKIPIYRGLLGLRLLLIHKDDITKFESVTNIEDLRKLKAGHGKHWADLPIFKENALKVKPHNSYEHIFKMLKSKRVDYFHRGVTEIWQELERHSAELTIANKVTLYYPYPVYFFVSRDRPELAKKIKEGLELAIKDSSYRELFLKTYGNVLSRAKISEKSMIELKNSALPKDTPAIDTSWWSLIN